MSINIPTKSEGDKLTASEFNQVVNAIKTLEENISGGGDTPTHTDEIATTEEKGFFVVDSEKKIGMKYDANGLDVAKLSDHFKALLPKQETGGGTVTEPFDHLVFNDLYMVDNKYQENQFIPVLQSERFTNDSNAKKYYPLLDGGYVALPAIGQLSSTDAMMSNGTTKDVDMNVVVGCENNLQTYQVRTL